MNNEKIYELRNLQLFENSLGEDILKLKNNPDVIEIMLNPDNKLWVDTLTKGMYFTGIEVNPEKSRTIINLVANSVGTTITEKRPKISAEIPGDGSRFEGILPPITKILHLQLEKKLY